MVKKRKSLKKCLERFKVKRNYASEKIGSLEVAMKHESCTYADKERYEEELQGHTKNYQFYSRMVEELEVYINL